MIEIAYVIDPDESDKYNQLVLRLVEAKKEGGSLKLIPFPSPIKLSFLHKHSSDPDKEALNFLIDAELQFQHQSTGRMVQRDFASFHLIHISSSQVSLALKLLAATNKLYFQGKQLVIDLFGKVEFYYQIEILNQNKIQVSGRLKWRDTDIAIQECDFVGNGKPYWFIRGFSLKLIATHLSWKNLKQAYQNVSWILEGHQKTDFLDQLDIEDLDSAQAIIVGGTDQEAHYVADPLPLLKLKDRVGACADLWMDYGNGHLIAFHDTQKVIKSPSGLIKRQLEAEKNWEKDLLETDFIKKLVSSSHYYCPVDKVAKSLSFLLELGWSLQDWKGNQVIYQGSSELAIDQSGPFLIVKGHIHYATHKVNIADVVGSFNRRERFVQLGSGQVGLLPERWEQAGIQELAEEGEIVGKEIKINKNRVGSVAALLDQSHLSTPVKSLKELLSNATHIESVTPGVRFKGQLREYQQQGLNWLFFLAKNDLHGILADDMGLGKTVQVLALLSLLTNQEPHLIVVPTSLLFNWKNEIERFLPDLGLYLHQGTQRAKTLEELKKHSLILTSYTLLRIDLPLFQGLNYQSLILDEAQTIKNAHTQIAQALYSLQSLFRLSVTGTPIENHLNELWSHFRFLIPDLFGSEESFTAELQAANADNRYLQRIKKKVAPFILRRRKEDVAKDLPERVDQTVWVTMSEEQRSLYDRFLAGFRGNLLKKVELEGTSKHRLEIFEALLRLRQICCHPLLVSSLDENLQTATSAKFEALEQDLETAIEEGRKVLIYSQFTSMLKLMTKKAHERGWSYTYLDGQTTHRERVVSEFQNDPSLSLFFISLKAGGVGLNLTAADYVFLFDPWWNEAVEEQAINRAHRIGRQQTVIAKKFITSESIEEKMVKLKTSKRLLVEGVIESDESPFDLSIEDLHDLLS